VRTLANTLLAPCCQTRTVPERSVQNSRPSGAKASDVAKFAAMVPLGAGSPGEATQALAVGVGVAATGAEVDRCVALEVGAVVEPQAATQSKAHPTATR
jgi:hypothetical protein